jgi:hypothetical protein
LERPGEDRLDLARVRLRAGEHLPLNGRLLGLERPGEDRDRLRNVVLRCSNDLRCCWFGGRKQRRRCNKQRSGAREERGVVL